MEEIFLSSKSATTAPSSSMLLIPSSINEYNIAPRAKMLYAILLEYTLRRQAPPTQQQMAARLGITSRSIRSYLAMLQRLDLVTVTQRGAKRPNSYGVRGI